MANTAQDQTTQHPQPVHNNAPLTIATTVQPATVPVANPLLSLENWTPFLLLIAAVAAVIGLFTKHITGKLADFEKSHKPLHENQDRELRELKHKLANERTRIDSLDRDRQKDVERIVAVETNMANIKEGQQRIEHALEKMSADLGSRIDAWAEQFSQSIREVRDVKPR